MNNMSSLLLLLVLTVLLAAGVGTLVWRWHRRSWLIVPRGVRCPIYDHPADLAVRMDPDAAPARQHVNILACSLLSDGAVGLPEQKGYLADMPPCEVVLERASAHPIYATDAPCRQPCLHILNAAASGARPLTCASGVGDGLDLMRQADRHAAGCQSLWYGTTS